MTSAVIPFAPAPVDAASDREARIARLERRLSRELLARREAEAIAEAATHRLYRQGERMRLLADLALEANRSDDLDTILRAALRAIGSQTGWPVGHVQLVETDAEAMDWLQPSTLWLAPTDTDIEALQRATTPRRAQIGGGVPGQVLLQRGACSIESLASCPPERRRAASALGLHQGVGFPVLVGDEIAAVVEFFHDHGRGPDAETLAFLDQVGAVLGRVFERRRAERAAQEARARLEESLAAAEAASRAKTHLLAVASHEVRTPLNAVLGLAEVLARSPLDATQREHVDGVRQAGGMLLRLLSSVLDFARIESGATPLVPAAFNLADLAREVTGVWRGAATAAQLDLRLELSACPDPCWISADSGKIEQTLTNLVSNAIKFTPVGGKILVRVETTPGPSPTFRIVVEDTGAGVPAEDIERIFDPFQQAPLGREVGGAGLGLAICAANLRAMGGDIGYEPAPEQGSHFWFSFVAEAIDAQAEPAPLDALTDLPLRILAAEDNPANQRVLRLLLEQVGITPTLVEDGSAAVEAARSTPFDLILMDANMPRMDGPSAVEAIRALGIGADRTPIVMLTANVFEDDIRRYRAAGADGVLAKPLAVAELYAVLADVQNRVAGEAHGGLSGLT